MKAFVLMPFSKEFDDVYRLGIQEAAKSLEFVAERLDDQIFATDMLAKIYSEIDNADLIIADMSKKNPNVFYEVGYADAKRKIVILLTNNSKDIPFDMLHRPHIIYPSVGQLKLELIKKLEWAVTEITSKKKVPVVATIKEIGGEVVRNEFSDTGIVTLRIELYNRTEETVDRINSIYIYTRKDWSVEYNGTKCTKTKSDIEPFEERHIVQTGITSIPGSDWIPFEVQMKRSLYQLFAPNEERSDVYELDGVIKISINTGRAKLISEHKVKVNVRYNESPF